MFLAVNSIKSERLLVIKKSTKVPSLTTLLFLSFIIDVEKVREKLENIIKDEDLSRYIL